MSIGYTWEKLHGAVLAQSDGPLAHRLACAYRAMHMLTAEDFPDKELRHDYFMLMQTWNPGACTSMNGTTAPAGADWLPTRRVPWRKNCCACIPTSRS
jgi:hypothetical protein